MIPAAVVYPYEAPSGFGVIKSLYLAGVPIIGLNHKKHFAAFSNKFKSLLCPDPIRDPNGFVDFLITLGKKNEKSVFFGALDIVTALILLNKKALSQYYYYPYLDDKTIDVAFNKWTMFCIAKQLAIPVPDTIMPSTIEDIGNADLPFPSVVKPLAHFIIKEGGLSKIEEFSDIYKDAKALEVLNKRELAALCHKALGEGFEIIAQEEIPGGCQHFYETKFYVDQKGHMSDITVSRKIRQLPADFGVCSFGEIAHCEVIKDYTIKFVNATNYRGLGELEFKYDQRDGKFKFIEFNPRANQWISITTFSGNNLVLRQYEDFAGKIGHEKRHRIDKTKWFDLRREIGYWARYGLDRSSPYYISFMHQSKSLSEGNATEAFLSSDDPILSIAYMYECIKIAVRKIIKHVIFKLTGIDISRYRQKV
ncbi:MAG: hypothetical protein ABSB18_07290 [Candidatus Omnitrophota bacterium]